MSRMHVRSYELSFVCLPKYVSIVSFLRHSTSNIGVTLKCGLGVVQGHCKWHHSTDRVRVSIRLPLYCIVSEIKGDAGPKRQFSYPFHLTCTIIQNPFEFRSKILTQTVRVLALLGGEKILRKSSTLWVGYKTSQTDMQTTDRQIFDDIRRT